MAEQTFGAGGAAAGARLDQLVSDARAKAERYQAMRVAAGQVSATGSSPDGIVTATVDSGGNVTDLRITDRVREFSGEQVAAAVLAAMRHAQAKLAERLRAVMTATIGDDQNTIDTIVGKYREKFPEPEPDQPPQAYESATPIDEPVDPLRTPRQQHPAPRPPQAPTDEDDDWTDKTVLR
jgi:DNA-binding protein YbaB